MDAGGFPLLAARLRQARQQLGLSSAQAARRAGVGRTAWANWEAGARAPTRSAAQVRRICDTLHADPAWLYGLTPLRRPWPPGTAPHPSPKPGGPVARSLF